MQKYRGAWGCGESRERGRGMVLENEWSSFDSLVGWFKALGTVQSKVKWRQNPKWETPGIVLMKVIDSFCQNFDCSSLSVGQIPLSCSLLGVQFQSSPGQSRVQCTASYLRGGQLHGGMTRKRSQGALCGVPSSHLLRCVWFGDFHQHLDSQSPKYTAIFKH